MEIHMLIRNFVLGAAIGLAASAISFSAVSQEHDQQALIKAMADAKVSLQQGLTSSQREGRPISAKFELEDGKLQLSIYTEKDGKFSEVIVDHNTGSVAKSEPITEGDDLTHAKTQTAAMAKAKTQLKDAVDKAVSKAAGARPVSATAEMKGGRSVASIELLRGGRIQSVTEELD
jgi:predicted small secreted protein